ncbi:hypothetical protein AVEN_241767-1 [Araneus ventricosus]|uniref:Uncharacterized protein n=1 Tax=Araneus ventricosus TaxID=182803 RepID=A0A4Y2FGN9_ARAVE|nr:hypothetical protein AVEN_241767-1 [Araneus ventricosus]
MTPALTRMVNMSKSSLRCVDFSVTKYKWKQIANLFQYPNSTYFLDEFRNSLGIEQYSSDDFNRTVELNSATEENTDLFEKHIDSQELLETYIVILNRVNLIRHTTVHTFLTTPTVGLLIDDFGMQRRHLSLYHVLQTSTLYQCENSGSTAQTVPWIFVGTGSESTT